MGSVFPHIRAMRILILQAHPRPSASIAQKALVHAARQVKGVTVHDLYEAYPDHVIDQKAEQALLLSHDLIILQHPFYWYSSPSIIKEWQDIVLDFGWAYGPGGDKLHGKYLMSALTTGGAASAYHAKGRNRFEVEELLAPFNQTAYLCGMAWLRPFIVYEGRRLTTHELTQQAEDYRSLLEGLVSGRTRPLTLLSKHYTLPASFRNASPP
jgi:glutathione-regulated potassium-efflux system ancillary protein KefG